MKLDLRYSQKLYYREIIEVSDEDYAAALALFKQKFDESEYQYYENFDEFLEDCSYEFLKELGISHSFKDDFIVDGGGIEDSYFLIIDEIEKKEED